MDREDSRAPLSGQPSSGSSASESDVGNDRGRPGGAELKPAQRRVLQALKSGRNVFALLPTGYGKSLCYQWPALHWGWRVVVVQPLVALMEDQATRMNHPGVLRLHSGLTAREERGVLERMDRDDWRMLFVSPERLVDWMRQGFWWNRAAPDLLAMDEFHCVEEWHNFRPAYAVLGEAVRQLAERGTRIGAFTATMPVARARRVFQEWGVPVEAVDLPLGRENLGTWVGACEHSAERWLSLAGLLGRLGRGRGALVYCPSRSATENLAQSLTSMGFSAGAFHAGLPADMRLARARGFLEGHLQTIVATSAFGMGMDREDVDLVVHWGLPWSVEGSWQEAGRAGRGGQEAHHVVLWCRSDWMRFRGGETRRMGWALAEHLLYRGCRKRALAEYFGVPASRCGGCNHCCREPGRVPASIRPVEKIIERTPWWLCEEASPREWIRKFLEIS